MSLFDLLAGGIQSSQAGMPDATAKLLAAERRSG
jgi:hypothetical protein